jgi:MFS family permease
VRAAELRAVLRDSGFRRLYATRLASQLTDGLLQAALAGYVFFSPERQTSAGKAAAAFAAVLLPYSLLGPFVGVFIDRWSRRQILVLAPVVRAGLVIGTAALLSVGEEGAPFFISVLFVLGVNRFFLAALSAALPRVTRPELLVTANALAVTSGTIIAFAGAGVGYLLRLLVGGGRDGTVLILLCSAGCYLLAGLVATTLGRRQLGPDLRHAPPQAREAIGSVLRGLADGARAIWRHRPVLRMLTVIAFHRFLFGAVLIMTLLLYRNTFSTGSSTGLGGFAVALGLSGAGFLAGAVITPPVVRRIGKDAWVTGLLLTAAVSAAAFLLPFTEPLWLAGGFVLGVVSQGIKLCVDATIQELLADVFRGRVFAVYDMLFNATFAAAAAVAAALVPAGGESSPVLTAIIVAYAAGAVLYWRAARRHPATAPARQPASRP